MAHESTSRRLLYVCGDAARRTRFAAVYAAVARKWTVEYAANAAQAFERLAGGAFQGVIADLHHVELPIGEFMRQVSLRHPELLRFVFCRAEEQPFFDEPARRVPHALFEDLQPAQLVEFLERAFFLEQWIGNEALHRLLPRMRVLPTLPPLYRQVVSELQSPTASLDAVAELVGKDPIMTAKILQMANAACFARAEPATSAAEAVFFLGAERTKALIMAAHLFAQFDHTKCPGFSLEFEWWHSMEVAGYAQAIYLEETRDVRAAELAFTAGLLHDIGKALLAANATPEYVQVLKHVAEGRPLPKTESLIFGATHAEIGAYLLAVWGLPIGVLEAVAYHHVPSRCPDQSFSMLSAVHLANAFSHEHLADQPSAAAMPMDEQYVARLGRADRLNHWRALCGLPPQGTDSAQR